MPLLKNHTYSITGTVKYTRAYDSLKETCRECALSAPGRINSISMRKYTATLAQVYNVKKQGDRDRKDIRYKVDPQKENTCVTTMLSLLIGWLVSTLLIKAVMMDFTLKCM
jgi:hypothetical protein